MKLSIDEILDKIEKLGDLDDDYEIIKFIKSLNLTPEQIDILADHENKYIKIGLAKNPKITEKVMIQLANDEDYHINRGLAQNSNLTEKVMILLSSDEDEDVRYFAVNKLKNLNSLKKEELEKAYDLINNSKYISRENFEETFDYIISTFPELFELAKMFKTIILKGKKDLK